MLNNRYGFVLLYDCTDSNPNGNPDAGNQPRLDPYSNQGIVTDVCIKRKTRNVVATTHGDKEGFDIYVKDRGILATEHEKAYTFAKKGGNTVREKDIQEAMAKLYWDVRTYGAVMNVTDYKCGQLTGPIQLGFSRSIDEIQTQEHTITRTALTNFGDTKKGKKLLQAAEDDNVEIDTTEASSGQMGSKWTVPYGLYRVDGHVAPYIADKSGFDQNDLELFWYSLLNMFEFDRSAARPNMAVRNLFVFEHESKLGNYPAHKLAEMISISRKPNVVAARRFSDYIVNVPDKMPAGITLHNKLQEDYIQFQAA